MNGSADDLGIAIDVLRTMRNALGSDRFRQAVEEAESEEIDVRKRRSQRTNPKKGARRAAELASPDDIARARARRAGK